jgi:manganese/iron transport system permease protein
MPITDFVADLFNPDLAFLPKALAIATMSSIVCGVIGCYVVLRGMAFIGDGVAHAVFPGLAVSFVVSGNLIVGGTIAGVLTAVLIAIFSQNRRLREDSIIGIFFVAAFALGIVIISRAPGYAGSLQQFLFGSITGIPDRDLYVVGITSLVVLGVAFALHKELVAVTLDREMARALGLKVFWLDIVLYVMVTLAVVISVQTIGNILVLALLRDGSTADRTTRRHDAAGPRARERRSAGRAVRLVVVGLPGRRHDRAGSDSDVLRRLGRGSTPRAAGAGGVPPHGRGRGDQVSVGNGVERPHPACRVTSSRSGCTR